LIQCSISGAGDRCHAPLQELHALKGDRVRSRGYVAPDRGGGRQLAQ